VESLFALNDDLPRFKLSLRDFLIQLKEFSGDNTELYAEDREKEQKDAKDAERERAMKVGGLLKPAEIDQDDELWLERELRTEYVIQAQGDRQHSRVPSSHKPAEKESADGFDGWDMYGHWLCRSQPLLSTR